MHNHTYMHAHKGGDPLFGGLLKREKKGPAVHPKLFINAVSLG